MACRCKVIFAPVHLAPFRDQFAIDTQLGTVYVDLVAKRPSPELSLTRSVDLGPCLVGSSVSRTITVKNTGGSCRVCLIPKEEYMGEDATPEEVILKTDWLESHEEELPPQGSIHLAENFNVDARGHTLPKGASSVMTVNFSPKEHGHQSIDCYLLADDCTYIPVTFCGLGSEPKVRLGELDGLELKEEVPAPPELLFGTLTVRSSHTKTAVFENTSDMDVNYRWLLFEAPDVVPDCSHLAGMGPPKSNPQLNPPSDAFSISELKGTMAAHTSAEFKMKYEPQRPGKHRTLIRLMIQEPLSGHEFNMIEFVLEGEGKLCTVTVDPPVLFFSGSLLMGVTYKRQFTLTNSGTSETKLQWTPFRDPNNQDEDLQVSVLPEVGALAANETKTFELSMNSSLPGHVPVSMECTFELAEPVVLFAEASVQGPQIRIDDPVLDYGLCKFNDRVSFNITMVNTSQIPANWLLTDNGGLERDENSAHVREFFFVPPHGCIAPNSSEAVTVCFKPHTTGKYHNHIELHTEDDHTQFLEVHAMVQQPKICLNVSSMDLGTTYLGVWHKRRVMVQNLSMLPTHFDWESIIDEGLEIDIQPRGATLKPAEIMPVTIGFKPYVAGPISALLGCSLEGAICPLGLGIETTVDCLKVEYGVKESNTDSTKGDEVVVDFGDEVQIFKAQTRTFLIQNKSAIPAEYKLEIKKFPTGSFEGKPLKLGEKPPKPPVGLKSTVSLGAAFSKAAPPSPRDQATGTGKQFTRSTTQKSSVEMSRLKSTQGLKPSPMEISAETVPFRSAQGRGIVAGRIRQAQEQTALCDDHGVAFGVNQTEGTVLAWETVEITVTCYTNMPGRYEDELIIDVTDLPRKTFKIQAGVRGSPMSLDPTCVGLFLPKDEIGKLTFEPVLCDADPLCKELVLLNAGPFDLEAKVRVIREPRPFVPADLKMDFSSGAAAVSIEPHTLQQSDWPFKVEPSSIIIPSKGKAKVAMNFLVGSDAASYDHCLLVQPTPKGGHPDAELPSGFLPALYTNISASVMPPGLETVPKKLLHFAVLSSESIGTDVKRRRTVTVTNKTPSMLTFKVKTDGPFEIDDVKESLPYQRFDEPDSDEEEPHPGEISLTPKELAAKAKRLKRSITLKPLESLSVAIKFVQEPEEAVALGKDITEYDGSLLMDYANGSRQEYPLTAEILYPAGELSVPSIDFGIVRVGADSTDEIYLTAQTLSSSQWSLVTAGSTNGTIPRRGSVSTGRRASVTGVKFRRTSVTGDVMSIKDPFVFGVQGGFFECEVELRFIVKGGESVSRRRKVNVGGWLASLTQSEAHEFYEIGAGESKIPRAPWGQQILNWIYQFAPQENIEAIKQSNTGADTFICVFLGPGLAEWFELRKDANVAGALEGKSMFLKDDPSQVKLKVTFTPEGDETYLKRYQIRLEHDRVYTFDVRGQGTTDEELID